MPKEKKKNTKRNIAFVLACIALAFLLLNSIYFLISKNQIIAELSKDPAIAPSASILPTILFILVITWLVLFVIMSYITYLVEKNKKPWYYLLIISIITIFSARIETSVLGIVSSILYREKRKK